jgi:metal-responsive CopG/Arc/MetJ family transcriptional regulator
MPPKPQSQQVLLRLEKNTLDKIDDFRFAHRFESRTETIRWLLNYALKQNPKPKKRAG